MKTATVLTSSILLTLTLIVSVQAGQVTDNLQAELAGANGDQLVPVWIQLDSQNGTALLKAAVSESDVSRAKRNRATVQQLKQTHSEQQQSLVATLRQLEAQGQVRNIKQHWMINLVEAEIKAGSIASIAAHDDVIMIHAKPRITSVLPDKVETAPPLSTGVRDHLTAINADDAWAAGYTGQGRLVCSFDTGVDGDHPALSSNWKGNDGNHAAAWFDPRYDGQSTPRSISECGYSPCNTSHGTHTMGTMVGHDTDTIGVAPDALWISAAVIDVTGTSIVDAFEWAANPDGDLNTIDDVPDVINHSWGVADVGCENLFYGIVEATEALGIVNIFAAGNEGAGGSETIRNPANRALDSIDCFAVGNVDMRSGPPTVYFSSSRGPSDCNGAAKPNVTAPGVSIYSSVPGGSYQAMTGTSMAAPQVAGLVALMRQKNPSATVEQIKTAILSTARDFGHSLPDNDFGWGVIDCMAALNALPAGNIDPNVRLYSFDHAPIAPGDTVRGTVDLQNSGQAVSDVSISLTSSEPLLSVITGTAVFGDIDEGEVLSSFQQIEVAVSEDAIEGDILSLDMQITGSGGYSESAHLYFLVEPNLERSIGTHDVGRIRFSLTNFGSFGLGDGQFFPAGGEGFTFDGSPDYLYEGGLIIGTDETHVSDGLRNAAGELDGDFGVLPGGNIAFVEPGPNGSQQMIARFGDHRAENPLNIEITQLSFAYPQDPFDDFIILQYAVFNNCPVSMGGIYVGIYADWDVVNFNSNAGGFASFDEFVWTAYHTGFTNSQPRGVMVLDGNLATALTHPGTLVSYSGDGFTEAEKYWALTNGTGSADIYADASIDLVQLIAVGPLNLIAGEVDTVAFALLAADDLSGMTDASDRARVAYNDLMLDADDEGGSDMLPDGFTLNQNYPNPFNPSTTISFVLPRRSEYRLSIYNVAGQRVTEIIGQGGVGTNRVDWNADGLATGIYLYKLTAGDFSSSRKMLLLR
ncbi:MAG: S8 family peptidase [candidate division Zixibacteria bacterium]|nr:S8 family peptidase [candidate division Zixibacteria bacterium]MDH3937469.1 S8 family peptidase [candidate division Zixibacteria bacterium]MDH4032520.1 S8 family peptidase [candidate division Zixibacteria bacterium]